MKLELPNFGTYADAIVRAPYSETDYSQEITVTLGAKTDSKQWKPMTLPLGAFLAKLCRHVEGPKDGPAFVLADMVPGQRLKNSVKTLFAVGLDVDTGTPSDEIDAALTQFNHLAVRYSTHSHNKTKTEFKKDKVVKFTKNRPLDDDVIRGFLTEVERWHPNIVETAFYAGVDHNERGIVVQVNHAPMPKHRIVVPFLEPFEIAKEASLQKDAMAKWAKVPKALADLLNVPLDTSCTDPSRLFYFPRHTKDRPFEVSIWGGSLFDWRTLTLDNPLDKLAAEVGKSSGKSATPEGKDLGRWSLKRAHGFQIADVIEEHCPDRIRGNATRGFDIECPFDEDHSNAGDTNDKACFVVNAGDGQSEFFTVSCRHETCRDKTMLDMVGKMLRDGWFDKDVLEDERYNATVAEDAPQPEVAEKLEKEDGARAAYQVAIDALTEQFTSADIEHALGLVVAAKLGHVDLDLARQAIHDRTGLKLTVITSTLRQLQRAAQESAQDDGASVDKKTQRVMFKYRDEYQFDEACVACSKAIVAKNQRDKLPIYSQMSGFPVRLKMEGGGAGFSELNQNGLWSELNNLVSFVRRGERGACVGQSVPRDVAAHLFEQSYRLIPETPEIFYTPTHLANGKLLLTPGYHFHPEHNLNALLLLDGLDIPPIPDPPTEDDAKEAMAWLRTELLDSFQFHDADKDGNEGRHYGEANALAMLLTPFMRRLINGRTPLFFIKKPNAGDGSTLLALLSIALFDGDKKRGGTIRYTTNEEELSKQIAAALLQSPSHLFFDNVRSLNSPTIQSAITSPQVSARELGRSHMIERDNNFNWIATGINPNAGEEIRRRSVFIQLNDWRPKEKRKYRHADLLEFVRVNRGLAICHVLTLIDYWLLCGEPLFTTRTKAGFADWAARVGGLLELCGVEGFLANREPLSLDKDRSAETTFFNDAFAKWGKDSPQAPGALFDWAEDITHQILRGRTTEDRRTGLYDLLPGLVGRTFESDKEVLMFDVTDSNEFGFRKVAEIEDDVTVDE